MMPNMRLRLTFLTAFYLFFTFHYTTSGGTDGSKDNLPAAVFKFIYSNERICGDMFVNTSWLPAHQNCELKCRMDSEICQMSSENVIIRRQRCYELPIECRRRLKQLLGGAELYTKPRRREGPATAAGPRAALKVQKQKQHNKQLAVVKPAATPHSTFATTPAPLTPRQIHISLQGRRPLMDADRPELVPLSLDRQILIPPAQLMSGTASPPGIRPPGTKGGGKKQPTSTLIQMPTQSREHNKKPLPSSLSSRPSAAVIKTTKQPSVTLEQGKVDDSLQIAYQKLYMMDTQSTESSYNSTIQAYSSPTTTVQSSSSVSTAASSLQLPRGSQSTAEEWTSAELGQPFTGNPFGGVDPQLSSNPADTAGPTGPTELSVLSAPLLTQLQLQPPLPVSAGEQKTISSAAAVNVLGKEEKKNRQIYVFSPGLSAGQLAKQQAGFVEKSGSDSLILPDDSGQLLNGHHQPTIQIRPIGSGSGGSGDIEQKAAALLQKLAEQKPRAQKQRILSEFEGKQMTWWSWRSLAESLRGKKPSSFYNSEGDILSVDKSSRCCQWALDGLCDRSWQRVRELCPKSCGTVVCSSIDGVSSCNRLVNVDVIACYAERRHSTNLPLHGAPTVVADAENFVVLQEMDHLGITAQQAEQIDQPKSAERRAFAMEEEFRMISKLSRQRNDENDF